MRNDHVALRTYDLPGIGIDDARARRSRRSAGSSQPDRYRFADKKLVARYWQHPDPALPKVFISELCVAELSAGAQPDRRALVAQLPAGFARADLPWAGRPWKVRRAEYESLLAESEYAAWVAAFGFRVNHFTVDVNALTTFPDLAALERVPRRARVHAQRRRAARSRARRRELARAVVDARRLDRGRRSPATHRADPVLLLRVRAPLPRCRRASCSRASCRRRPTRSSSRPTSSLRR